ncbi:baseplate J/gp47 family protein [Vitiosangium sp. GDMCC 1.1324]|uniref:baseplate J/gp47 family protein n=1 Tax=Vitiosangium sp. (strain GDMCC 1.1324) TaxID=2138576 RepID=UPI000D36C9C3|nr:baseplate J/gp47 family protein [Vitiosangium sp. GDMCC 1.1324]PTL79526.1 hypothetical protein DAT35_32440 [Vitiosangium sp. GDMCC 1.1324]
MTDRPYNPPGRAQLEGRLGTRATFLERMRQRLARVSASAHFGDSEDGSEDGSDLPVHGIPLTQVPVPPPPKGSGEEPLLVPSNDFTHGLLDGWATLADILCFYQERILNEGYLRTATEDFSVRELVETLGVQPQPPVSARVDLCFTVSDKPGAPESLTLPRGLAVQSIPGPEEKPQIFETSAPLLVRAEWNELKPWQPSAPQSPAPLRADAHAVLLEKGTQDVRPGDLLLLRTKRSDGSVWAALKTVRRVGRSRRRGCSLLAWDEPLDATLGTQLLSDVEVWTTRTPEPLLGTGAKPWAELPLKDRLRLGTPWGGVQRMDAPWSTWKNVQRGLPEGTVLCLGAHEGNLLASVEDKGLLRSKDAGETWETLALPTAHVDVLCLGHDSQGRLMAGTRRHGVIRSADGGGSWELLKGQVVVEMSLVGRNPRKDLRLPPSPVRSVAAFVSGEDNSAAAFLVAGTDEGVFSWEEATATWRPFNEGLPMGKADDSRVPVSVWAVVTDATRATFLIATSHGVFTTKRLGDKWERKDPGRAGQASVAALVDEQGRLFVALEDGALYRSTDNGKTYATVTPSGALVRSLSLGVPARGSPAPLLAATSRGIFVSHDGGTSWVQPPALDPVESTAVVELAPFQLVAATPLLGVKERQWPGWSLEPGQLDVSRVLPRLSADQPLVLDQAAGDGTPARRAFLSITGVETVQVKDFELRGLVSRVHVTPEAVVTDFDRGQARVHAVGLRLKLLSSQVRDNRPLEAGTPDAVLDADTSFEALVREPQDAPSDSGDRLLVDGAIPDPTGRLVLVEGRRMRVRMPMPFAGTDLPELVSEDGLERQALKAGEVLEVMARPNLTRLDAQGRVTWLLCTERGFTGTAAFKPGALQLLPSSDDGETAVERRQVASITGESGATLLIWDKALEGLMDPATLIVHANVAEGTHGGTIPLTEVLGSGNATQSFQSFRLKRSPLAWVATADGPEPQIEVRVDQRRWHRVEDWSGQGPDSYVYVLRQEADGRTSVVFGDGLRGARLPTGQENVTALYRVGSGPEGNVGARRIRMLRNRPLGLDSVDNPLAASGGSATEPSSSLRTSAPLRVRTLDRIVSPRDFEDFVRTYPGVARVRARQVWNGHEHVLFLTVATDEEASQHQLLPGSALDVALRQALEQFRPSTHTVDLGSYVPRHFELAVTLTVDPDFEPGPVKDAAQQVLGDAYAFERRELAQSVAASDILRELSAVKGVLNARITTLRPFGSTDTRPAPALLPAGDIHWDAQLGRVEPAEMLLLDVKTGLTLTTETGP